MRRKNTDIGALEREFLADPENYALGFRLFEMYKRSNQVLSLDLLREVFDQTPEISLTYIELTQVREYQINFLNKEKIFIGDSQVIRTIFPEKLNKISYMCKFPKLINESLLGNEKLINQSFKLARQIKEIIEERVSPYNIYTVKDYTIGYYYNLKDFQPSLTIKLNVDFHIPSEYSDIYSNLPPISIQMRHVSQGLFRDKYTQNNIRSGTNHTLLNRESDLIYSTLEELHIPINNDLFDFLLTL